MAKRGRPKIEIDLAKVEALAQNGATYLEIARALGIDTETLAKRRKDQKGVQDAIDRGNAKSLLFVQNELMKRIKEGSVPAAIFFLKARGGWKETSVNEVSGLGGGPVQIEKLKAKTDEELLAIINS